jgi:ABC-type glycerol-3-phosphate transport system substrate-binding protein
VPAEAAPRQTWNDTELKEEREMRRIGLVFLLAAVALAVLGADDKSSAIVLKFTDFQAGNEGLTKAYKEMAAIFEKAHPNVKIDYQQYGAPTYNEFLKPAIASGKGPDLMAVFPGPDLTDIGKAGSLRDLTRDIDPEWKGWLGPAYDFSGLRYGGKILVIPQDVWTEALWYYKDMLKSIGVDAAKMKGVPTAQDFIDMVKPAKAKGLNVVTAGFLESWCVYDSFYNYVHQQQKNQSVDVVQQAFDGKVSWKQDIFRNAINVFVRLNDAAVWNKDSLNQDYQVQGLGRWLNKESIFIYAQADWFAGSMTPAENSMSNPNVGIMQYPLVGRGSKVVYNKNFGSDIGVYAEGKHQDLAVAWCKLTNSPEASRIFVKFGVNPAAGVDKTKLPVTENPLFNELIKLYNAPGVVSEVYYANAEAQKVLSDGIISVMLKQRKVDEVLAELDGVCGFSQ